MLSFDFGWRHIQLLLFYWSVQMKLSASGEVVADTVINITIVSPGVLGNYTASSINLSGPGFDVGIARLNWIFRGTFNVSQTYLYDRSITDCVTFQSEVQNILAKWYYTVRRQDGLVVIMTPGE